MTVFSAAGFSPSILDRAGNESRDIAGVWWLMFVLAAVVYVVVAGLLFWALLHRRGRPSRLDESAFIVIGGVAAPVVILAVLAVATVTTTRGLRNASPNELHVHVVARDWWWDISYPGRHVRTANEIHVPAGRPIDLIIDSADVIHSVWLPQLAGKVDAIPGQTNHLRLTVRRAGEYLGECAEYCKVGHAHMRFVLIADSPTEFGRWLARHQARTGGPESESAANGERVFMRESCAGCHSVAGTAAVGRRGPDLTDFGARMWIGAVTLRNTPANLKAWIRDSQHAKPGNLMPPSELGSQQIDELVTYLEAQQ